MLPLGVVKVANHYAAVIYNGRVRHYLCYCDHPEDAQRIYDAVRLLLNAGYLTFETLPPPLHLHQRTLNQAERAKRLGVHANTIRQRAKRRGITAEQLLDELERDQMCLPPPTKPT
jgi:hypothetical protein